MPNKIVTLNDILVAVFCKSRQKCMIGLFIICTEKNILIKQYTF